MKRTLLIGVIFACAIAGIGKGGQEGTTPVVKEVEPFAYCALVQSGPLSAIGQAVGRLVQEMQAQNLFTAIRGPMVGVYENALAPAEQGEMAWEVGFVVTAQAEPLAPLVKKVWDHPTVASVVHAGPYSKVGETIVGLLRWMEAEGYVADGPLMERYLNNPMQVKPEELRTELWLPVRRK